MCSSYSSFVKTSFDPFSRDAKSNAVSSPPHADKSTSHLFDLHFGIGIFLIQDLQ